MAYEAEGQPRPPESKPDRKKNTCTKSNSPQWKSFQPYRGDIKTNGETGKHRRYYTGDHTHNDIEVWGTDKCSRDGEQRCSFMADTLSDERLPMSYSPTFREYDIVYIDDSVQPIHFCPWCGTKLPKPFGDEWFERVWAMGLEPGDPRIPEAMLTDQWWAEFSPRPRLENDSSPWHWVWTGRCLKRNSGSLTTRADDSTLE